MALFSNESFEKHVVVQNADIGKNVPILIIFLKFWLMVNNIMIFTFLLKLLKSTGKIMALIIISKVIY